MKELHIIFDEVMTDGQLQIIAKRLRSDLKYRGHRNFSIDVVDGGLTTATFGTHGSPGVASGREDDYEERS